MSAPNKLYCKHGHAMTVANTYLSPSGRHECRKCRSQRNTGNYTGTHKHQVNKVVDQGVRLYAVMWGPYMLVVDSGGWPRLVLTARERAMPCGLCSGWVLLGHGKPVCQLCGR